MYVPAPERLYELAVAADTVKSLTSTDTDWGRREPYTPPGIVWSVESDTCMSGPPTAPRNIACGTYGEEFVFRQPRDEHELAAVLRAARQEVYDCYRFDGLRRWTADSAETWFASIASLKVALAAAIRTGPVPDHEILSGLNAYLAYLDSEELRGYRRALLRYLSSPGRNGPTTAAAS